MTGDEYLQAQIQPMLQPGEQVLQSAYMVRQPGLLVQMFLVGGLLLFLMTKAYFAVFTNRRFILIRTKMGFWKGGPQNHNLGVEQYDARAITKCTTSGFANNRSMTFHMSNGPAQTLRISPWFKKVAGTKQFFEQVPNMINSGQLAQMAQGQLPPGPQMQQGPHMQQGPQGMQQGMQQQPHQQPHMQQPHMQPPHMQQAPHMQQPHMQQPHMQQPHMQQPHMQQPHAQPGQHMQHGQQSFSPGMQVIVAPGDGQRYPATVVQAAPGQYLCTMPNGQPYWFPAQQVTVS